MSLKENEKFTVPNKVLMVLSRRTGAHREDCEYNAHKFWHVLIDEKTFIQCLELKVHWPKPLFLIYK